MRTILSLVLLLAALAGLSAERGQERTFTVENVPNVHVADRTQYVSDPSGILSRSARDTINATFARLAAATGIQTAVVVLPSIGQDDPFDFSHRLFRHWGVGQKGRDNGLLILFVADQRKIRFTTGYGLEGVLPDALCKRIQMRKMIPAFSKGDYDGGMTAGAAAVYSVLKDSMKQQRETVETDNTLNYVFVVAAILLTIALPTLINRCRARCPRCRKRALRKMSSDTFRDSDGSIVTKDIYVCDNCGNIVHRTHRRNGGGGMGTLLGGFFLGSMLGRGGGGFGGDGSIGGSFGGGDSGGGGSDSGW